MAFHPEIKKNLPIKKVKDDESLYNGYEMLSFMCKNVRNTTTAFHGSSGVTERVVFIIDQLNKVNINYKVIPFTYMNVNDVGYGINKLMNIQVHIPATKKTKDTIIFTAHHDIVKTDGENCQDNTASVCNLLHLCKKLKETKNRQKNTIIVFTDGEEGGGRGAQKLANMIAQKQLGDIKVKGIVGLELTAGGSALWVETIASHLPITQEIISLRKQQNKRVDLFATPYNECMTLRGFGLNSVCIGILPEQEAEDKKNKKATNTWSLCHKSEDTFERSAVEKDMEELVEFLISLINKSFVKN